MCRKLIIYCLMLALLCFTVCKGYIKKTNKASVIVTNQIKYSSDTLIYLSDIKSSNYHRWKLTEKLSKKVLYKHFSKIGYYNEDSLPDDFSEEKIDICVYYDTLYPVNLNDNKYTDAIIVYHLIPCFASGHCFQPSKAIIVDSDSGYTITHENFLPDNYIIDSVRTIDRIVNIYGYYYDCSRHEKINYSHIILKK